MHTSKLVLIIASITLLLISLPVLGYYQKKGSEELNNEQLLKNQQATPSALKKVPQANEVQVPILAYHHVAIKPQEPGPDWETNVPPEVFNKQLQFLASNKFTTISFGELQKGFSDPKLLPKNPIILTFDDGYQSLYKNVYPILKKNKMRAVAFLITDLIGSLDHVTWDQITEMDKSNTIQFGSHSKSHQILNRLPDSAMIAEIKDSKEAIEQHVNKPVDWFAYPYGSYSDTIIQALKETSYAGAVTTIYGDAQSQDNIFLLRRITIDEHFKMNRLID